jgi:hypothetical protein
MNIIEKRNRPPNKATTAQIENFLAEITNLSENLGDDRIKSDTRTLVVDICKEHRICEQCLTEITTTRWDNYTEIECGCKSKVIYDSIAEGF